MDEEYVRQMIREEIRRFFSLQKETDELQIQQCLHDGLPADKIHMIACPCPRCSPRC